MFLLNLNVISLISFTLNLTPLNTRDLALFIWPDYLYNIANFYIIQQ